MNQAIIILQRREAVSRGSFLKEVMTRNMLMHNCLCPLHCALNKGECRSAIVQRQPVHSNYGGALRKWRHCPEKHMNTLMVTQIFFMVVCRLCHASYMYIRTTVSPQNNRVVPPEHLVASALL